MKKSAICLLVCVLAVIALPEAASGQWAQVGNPRGGWIPYLAVSGDSLFAATRKGGVFRSKDNGATWSPVNNGLPKTDFQCLAVVGPALFAGSVEHGAYRSLDDGATWEAASSGLPVKSSVWRFAVSGTTVFAVAGPEVSTVYRTTDHGKSWTPANSGLGDVQVLDLAAVGNDLFAGTLDGLSRSSDGGASWTQASKGPPVLRVAALGTEVFSGTYAMGRVSRSADRGGQWTEASLGLPDGLLFSLSDLAAGGPHLFLASFQGVYMIAADSEIWTDISAGLSDKASIYSLAASDTYLFAGTEEGQVWRLPLAELSLTANLADPVLTEEQWKRVRKTTPKAVIVPEAVKAALRQGLDSRQGRHEIPFTIAKVLTLPSLAIPGSLVLYDPSGLALVQLPVRDYDLRDWRYAVILFKARNADLGYAPEKPGPGAKGMHVSPVQVFLEFRQTDGSGASRVVKEVCALAKFEENGPTYDPERENWYSVGYNLRPGKYTVAMALAAPGKPGGDDLGKVGVAYADIELAGRESYRGSLETTPPFFTESIRQAESQPVTMAGKGLFQWATNEVVPVVDNIVPAGSDLAVVFKVLGAEPKPASGSKGELDLAVVFKALKEDGEVAVTWEVLSYDSDFITPTLPLVEAVTVQDDRGQRQEQRDLDPGKYILAIEVVDRVTGLKVDKRVPFEIR